MVNLQKSFVVSIVAMASLTGNAQESWNLEKCISYAIEHNLTVKQQEAARDQSAVELNSAKWSRLPNLSGSASHSFNFGRSLQENNTYESINTQSTGFNLSTNVPLFTGLQIPHTIAQAKLNLKAAMEDLNKAKDDISVQVTSAFLQVLFTEELAKVAHEQVSLSQEMLTQKEGYYRVGKASEADVAEARTRVAQDRLSAVQADNNYRLALLDLSQLLELPSPDGFAITSPEVDAEKLAERLIAPSEVYAEALLIRPSIKAAQYRLERSAHDIRIAQSAYYPQLSFGAGIGTNYYNVSGRQNSSFGKQLRDNFSQYLGFSLSIPLFDRFSTRNRVRSARLQQTALGWQLEESKKALYKEIQQAYYNAVGAESKLQSSQTADEAAQASFNLVKGKYAAGKATATEYNEARTAWMKAVSDRLQAKYDFVFRTRILDFYRGVPLTLSAQR